MYAGSRGRFTSPDPGWLSAANMQKPQSLNRYAYVNNDPVNFVDPDGLEVHPLTSCNGCSITIRGSLNDNLGAGGGGGGILDVFEVDTGYLDGTGGVGEEPQTPPYYAEWIAALDNAVANTDNILNLAGPCAGFFGGGALATHVLRELRKTMRPIAMTNADGTPNTTTGIGLIAPFSTTTSAPSGVQDNFILRLPSLAVVNANAGFITGSGSFGPYRANSQRGRVLAILHELAHLIGTRGPGGEENWLIPSDGSTPGQSEINTNTILERCGPEIENTIPEG
jgi:hypothetical protein